MGSRQQGNPGAAGIGHDPNPSSYGHHQHEQQHDHSPGLDPARHHHHVDGDPHDHHHRRPAGAFLWSIVLNSGLTALQLTVGVAFGSLALVGDALHNLGDVLALALGWGADRLSRCPPRGRFTYGFGRSTQLVSLLNGLLIVVAGAVVTVEAMQRLQHPLPVVAGPVAWAAAAGMAINLLAARLFGHDHHHDLNRRSAVLHLLTDAALSGAVLGSALLVAASGWAWLDSLTAIGVGGAVIWSALGLLREAIALNLDAAPRHLDLNRIETVLVSLPGVLELQDLHVWGVSTSRTALTAHLLIDPEQLAAHALRRDQLLSLARTHLAGLGIRQTTLQLEAPQQPPSI